MTPEPSPWSNPATETQLPADEPSPSAPRSSVPRSSVPRSSVPRDGKPRWLVAVIAVVVVTAALATALTVKARGGPSGVAPTSTATEVTDPPPLRPSGVYLPPNDLCQDGDYTPMRPTFTTFGDLHDSGTSTPSLVVARCEGSTGNDRVDGYFTFEVQVSANPTALADLFRSQRDAVSARVPITPITGLGTEAYTYTPVGGVGLTVDSYDANLTIRLSWEPKRATDRLPDGLADALAGTCRSTMRLLRQV